ncbi:hypothetical protein L7F22_032358 [Adiantum nelumboides]|nr:hypothetical protein [Adiantum nelumboides]
MEGRPEQLLVYSMVARGEMVLAEYSPFSADVRTAFSALAIRASVLLSSSARTPHKPNAFLSFTSDNVHTFHFLIQDELRFVVVSKYMIERKIAFKCLQRIKGDFYKSYMGDPNSSNNNNNNTNNNHIVSLDAHALDQEFGPKIKDHMEYCLDHYKKLQKLPSVRDQVQELKESVLDNIRKIHESQIKLEIDDLEVYQTQAENFHRQGKKLRNEMWIKQAKIKLVAIFSCVLVVFLIWIGICHGIKC